MKTKKTGTISKQPRTNMRRLRSFEHLEARRVLTMFAAGDANKDFYFDEADIIEVFKSGKFGSDEAATWAEGDWDGMMSLNLSQLYSDPNYNPLATPAGDGVFNVVDLGTAYSGGHFRDGTYLTYTSNTPRHSRDSLTSDATGADVVVIYDGSNGDVSIEGSDTIFSTFHLESESGIFSGEVDSDTLGIFDVAGRDGNQPGHTLFMMEPKGTSSRKFKGVATPGLTAEQLLSDLSADGARIEGGDVGPVGLVCINCDGEVSEPAAPRGDLNGDLKLGVEDIDLLSEQILDGVYSSDFDLNEDQVVDLDDLRVLVQDILNTNFGDANLDGVVDSRDMVLVYTAGQYEDGVFQNSTWSTGDWNADREFDSSDMVLVVLSGFLPN